MSRLQWVISQNLCRNWHTFFVKHGGKISCEITGSKRYSSDLEQGGLEIPAKIMFQNSNERIIEEMKKKLAPLSKEYNKKH